MLKKVQFSWRLKMPLMQKYTVCTQGFLIRP
jgi:hypothetical protein